MARFHLGNHKSLDLTYALMEQRIAWMEREVFVPLEEPPPPYAYEELSELELLRIDPGPLEGMLRFDRR